MAEEEAEAAAEEVAEDEEDDLVVTRDHLPKLLVRPSICFLAIHGFLVSVLGNRLYCIPLQSRISRICVF